VIVRISGTGQFDVEEEGVRKLDSLDTEITQAMHDRDEQRFHQLLRDIIELVSTSGTPVANDTVVPSDVIVPPDDITLDEAERFFTDEGLMQPLPA